MFFPLGEQSALNQLSSDYSGVIQRLRTKGVRIDAGLTDADFKRIESELGLCPPLDVREFLSQAVPVSGYFPDWRGDLNAVYDGFIEPVVPHFLFHVEHNVFWHTTWGPRPEETADALECARAFLDSVPVLFPLGDRMYLKAVPCAPTCSGNPVFSVRGSDVLHAGRNLLEYLTWLSEPEETTVDDPPTPVYCNDYRRIEFWTDVCCWNNSD